MYGAAGAAYTPGMPHLDAYTEQQRRAEREARQQRRNTKEQGRARMSGVRTRQQRRDDGHITHNHGKGW